MRIEEIFGDLPELETERLLLRKMRKGDAKDLYDYASDSEITRYTIWYSHKSLDESREVLGRFLKLYENGEIAPWGIEDKASGKLIGTTGFISWDTVNARAEVGYALSRRFWNKGYMSEAVQAVVDFGFRRMGLVRVEARCHPDNIGSARVMEKVGMQFEGVLRKHVVAKGVHEDVKMYSIIKED